MCVCVNVHVGRPGPILLARVLPWSVAGCKPRCLNGLQVLENYGMEVLAPFFKQTQTFNFCSDVPAGCLADGSSSSLRGWR